ncbi:uncharacterized protein EAE98_010724 [Botrytis deweyae]|uniref:Cyclin N-terminal domain-containing protein n=1 Tax=Botrytis deweyae TaxID=2478750 RepID=A0ABQ7I814_9HELO|nr:uncharacterized protein EAE98_010724 [Botrytis deweyae]KAF7916424.1 hypothetical protein EAE98_010724 [Botrytis deweyae]
MNPTMSPPLSMSSRKRSSSISSFDSFDSDFFEQTYVPLSNLPTPPLSSHSYDTTAAQSPISLFSSDEILDPDYLGPAIHLTNLIPSSTSLTDPSTQLVHAILTRADLPIEILALAVCILDSLNSRFARSWRISYPLESSEDQLLEQYDFPSPQCAEEQHIDSTHPEVIVLAALILAMKFIDDQQGTTLYYAQKWARGLWSCDQINFTQRAIMENLNYRLLPLWEEEIIEEAKMSMARAAKRQSSQLYCMQDWTQSMKNCGMGRPMSSGKACKGIEGENTPQPTPVELPFCEDLVMGIGSERPLGGTSMLSRETKIAFGGVLGGEYQDVDMDIDLERFPTYVDSFMVHDEHMNFV